MKRDKQEIKKESLDRASDIEKEYVMPILELTTEEKNIFAKSLATGKPFSKIFVNKKNPDFYITIREKTKKEGEIIGRSLDRAMESHKILNWVEYAHLYNSASLYYQVDSINGIEQHKEYPAGLYDDFDVMGAMERSPINEWNGSQVYIAMGWLFQFNNALMEVAREAFDDINFS